VVTVVNCRFVPCNRKVTRPSIFGNPFSHKLSRFSDTIYVKSREEAILKFAEYWYAEAQRGLRKIALQDFPPNATLGCVCHPKSCHADIIAGYLNWRRS
jgi:Domain of unknown function (DUF4326)